MATCFMHSLANEKEPLPSCSPSLDLVLKIDLVIPLIGELEFSLPPIDPSECSFLDIILPLDEDILEAMVSHEIPLDNLDIVLSNDHIFVLDCLTIEPILDFPFQPGPTFHRSIEISIGESTNSSI